MVQMFGMIQRGGGTRLALEAFEGQRVRGRILGKKLQCDAAVQTRVLGAVNDAHATAA